MNVDIALKGARRIYLDTAPLIYWVEEHSDYIATMNQIVDVIETSPLRALTSVVTLTEIMVQPLRMGNTDLVQEYHDILVSGDDYTLVTITADIAITAGEIRARYSLRTLDAIHVATAIATDCDTLLTNDAAMKRVTDLDVVYMDDLEL